MAKAKALYTVEVELPDGVGTEEMRVYILDAVRCWKGRGSPEDALFHLDGRKVKVKLDPQSQRVGG